MADQIKRIFSVETACLLGVLAVGVLFKIITTEKSIQPLRDRYWSNQLISIPLSDGIQFSQTVSVPGAIGNQEFLLALFFGCSEGACSGKVEVVLEQGDHVQARTSPELSPAATMRHQFYFSGFSEGPAVLKVSGMAGSGEAAPGLLYTVENEAFSLNGPDLPRNAYLSFDWFKILSGREKFRAGLPNTLVLFLWLIPFAGTIGLAWMSIRPKRDAAAVSAR